MVRPDEGGSEGSEKPEGAGIGKPTGGKHAAPEASRVSGSSTSAEGDAERPPEPEESSPEAESEEPEGDWTIECTPPDTTEGDETAPPEAPSGTDGSEALPPGTREVGTVYAPEDIDRESFEDLQAEVNAAIARWQERQAETQGQEGAGGDRGADLGVGGREELTDGAQGGLLGESGRVHVFGEDPGVGATIGASRGEFEGRTEGQAETQGQEGSRNEGMDPVSEGARGLGRGVRYAVERGVREATDIARDIGREITDARSATSRPIGERARAGIEALRRAVREAVGGR